VISMVSDTLLTTVGNIDGAASIQKGRKQGDIQEAQKMPSLYPSLSLVCILLNNRKAHTPNKPGS